MNKIVIFFVVLVTIQAFAEQDNHLDADICEDIPPMYQVGNKQYYVQTSHKINWYAATKNCRCNGMQLVSIQKDEEVTELSKLVRGLGFNAAKDSFWTSGNDLSVSNVWQWMGTGHKVELNTSSWFPGEPNHEGNEHCIVLWNENNQYKLNDIGCEYLFYYICEKVCDNH